MTEQAETKVCANPDCRVVFARKPKTPPSRWKITRYHDADCGRLARRAAAAAPKPTPVVASVPSPVTRLTWRPRGFSLRPGDAGYDEQVA